MLNAITKCVEAEMEKYIDYLVGALFGVLLAVLIFLGI
jgi:hypothetical protein